MFNTSKNYYKKLKYDFLFLQISLKKEINKVLL